MSDAEATELQPLARQTGVPRLTARPLFAGLELRWYWSLRPDAVPLAAVPLTRPGWEVLVHLYAQREPARFEACAYPAIRRRWQQALQDAGWPPPAGPEDTADLTRIVRELAGWTAQLEDRLRTWRPGGDVARLLRELLCRAQWALGRAQDGLGPEA